MVIDCFLGVFPPGTRPAPDIPCAPGSTACPVRTETFRRRSLRAAEHQRRRKRDGADEGKDLGLRPVSVTPRLSATARSAGAVVVIQLGDSIATTSRVTGQGKARSARLSLVRWTRLVRRPFMPPTRRGFRLPAPIHLAESLTSAAALRSRTCLHGNRAQSSARAPPRCPSRWPEAEAPVRSDP